MHRVRTCCWLLGRHSNRSDSWGWLQDRTEQDRTALCSLRLGVRSPIAPGSMVAVAPPVPSHSVWTLAPGATVN